MATVTDVVGIAGVRVGHWTDEVARTGCTLVDLPPGSVASVEVRGGAPASRELDALAPDKTVQTFEGVLLAGGSAFGLAAADGVMRFYADQGRGCRPRRATFPWCPPSPCSIASSARPTPIRTRTRGTRRPRTRRTC
ncbi:P1 family peptidase [Branchiibius cervicis]|uniref:P1 family peptidase n=1 Tax=Branchiibius cervicis TaxID=908252 RepID=A0ABW2AVP2_9MICO